MTSLVCLQLNWLVKNQFHCYFGTVCGHLRGTVGRCSISSSQGWGGKKRMKPRKTSFVRLGVVAGQTLPKVCPFLQMFWIITGLEVELD